MVVREQDECRPGVSGLCAVGCVLFVVWCMYMVILHVHQDHKRPRHEHDHDVSRVGHLSLTDTISPSVITRERGVGRKSGQTDDLPQNKRDADKVDDLVSLGRMIRSVERQLRGQLGVLTHDHGSPGSGS